MTFQELMAVNAPRLVVLHRRGGDGTDHFQWGVVGNIPILTLIGYLIKVQNELVADDVYMPECDQAALVIVWDEEHNELAHYKHASIPNEPLAGMLEVIKTALTMSRVAQHSAAQKVQPPILGPDGRPVRN